MSESESANDLRKIVDSAEKARDSPEKGDSPPRCTQDSDQHNAPDTSTASHTSAKESVLTEKRKTQASGSSEAVKKHPAEADVPSLSMLPNPVIPVTNTVTSASMTLTPKVIVSSVPVRSATPLVVGARVVSAAVRAARASGQTSASHSGGLAVMSNQVRPPAVTQAPLRAAIMALPRAPTLQQNVTVPRSTQTTSLQLPANFQIPQGLC